MTVLNLMFGQGRGGLEQAAYNYHEALLLSGHAPITLLHPRAALRSAFDTAGFDYRPLAPLGEWDRLASRRIAAIARQHSASAMIAHGNRAVGLGLRARSKTLPLIGVAHNYHIKKRFPKCDAVFCITRDLCEDLVHLNVPRGRLFPIPNLVRLAEMAPRKSFSQPLRIGALGRFVPKKGMDILLHAAHSLHQSGAPIELHIAGDGPLRSTLEALCQQLGIRDIVHFSGWIEDSAAFLSGLDIFVLPSHHEPFGIVLIEAMAAGLPCITTDTEGPCEIITHEVDAMMIEKAKPYLMAQAIREMIDQPERALAMGRTARATAEARYALPVVSAQLSEALNRVLASCGAAD